VPQAFRSSTRKEPRVWPISIPLEIGVTTGPIRGSRKIHVESPRFPGLTVAMREIALEPGSGEPPLRVYDTSGPYTDPKVAIDIRAGLPRLRHDWIVGRGDVESYAAREVKPEDNGLKGPDRSGGCPHSPTSIPRRCAPRPAPMSPRCTMRGRA
jgi:phosphomethylpyrimidine synthase